MKIENKQRDIICHFSSICRQRLWYRYILSNIIGSKEKLQTWAKKKNLTLASGVLLRPRNFKEVVQPRG